MNNRKIHFASGIIISLFVTVHLLNHAFSFYGAVAHINMMDTLRMVYRNIVVEAVLLVAIGVQIYSGLKLFITSKQHANSGFEKLHIWSGLYLAIFFAIHLSAVLAGRLLLNLDTNFYFGVAGINTFPFNLFFVPYYALAILSFFGHIAAIHRKKMSLNLIGLTPKAQALGILCFGVLFTAFVFYGLTNHFNGVVVPDEYGVLIGK